MKLNFVLLVASLLLVAFCLYMSFFAAASILAFNAFLATIILLTKKEETND